MFDIGFPELLIVSIVALLVIGPERLPEAVRSMALWIGRFRRSFASIRAEIEREIGADDIRRQLHNESIMADLERSRADLNAAASEVRGALRGTAAEVRSAANPVIAPRPGQATDELGLVPPDPAIEDADTPGAGPEAIKHRDEPEQSKPSEG